MKLADVYKIARWEFLKTLRSTTFLVLTFIIPLFIVAAGGIGFFVQMGLESEELEVAVIDETENFYPILEEHLADTQIILTDFEGEKGELVKEVEEGVFDGYLRFDDEALLQTGEIPYYVSDARDMNVGVLRGAINQPVQVYRLQHLGLSAEEIEKASLPVNISARSIEGEEPQISDFLAPLTLAMMLLLAVIFSGQVLMYGVIKEKKNRIVEILLSSVSSLDLMLGKVLGYGLLGLMQVAIWISAGLAVVSFFGDISHFVNLRDIIPSLLVFIFGYLLLASLFATVGSIMKEAESGSQAHGLVIMIPILPLFISGLIITSPNSLWVRILSFLPPFSPVTSLLRIGATTLPLWEIISIILVLIISALVFVKVGAIIFEGGILQYDRNLSFKDVRQMFR